MSTTFEGLISPAGSELGKMENRSELGLAKSQAEMLSDKVESHEGRLTT
jgi:hypothetical protein